MQQRTLIQQNLITPTKQPLPITIDTAKELGKGMYGRVYVGQITATQQKIAVKICSEEEKELLKEIDIMEQLTLADAPNTIHIYGFELRYLFFTHEATIAMAYAENGSLYDWLDNPTKTPLTPEQQMQIMHGIANGLAYVHAANIIHCDIKSPNVLLDENMKPLLCDFGLSKRIGTDNLFSIAGSPLLYAPELLLIEFCGRWGEQTQEADIYSLSLLFWCIVANKKYPFSHVGDDSDVLVEWVVTQDKREDIPPSCPDVVKDCITDGWSADPADRPSADGIATTLKPTLAAAVISAATTLKPTLASAATPVTSSPNVASPTTPTPLTAGPTSFLASPPASSNSTTTPVSQTSFAMFNSNTIYGPSLLASSPVSSPIFAPPPSVVIPNADNHHQSQATSVRSSQLDESTSISCFACLFTKRTVNALPTRTENKNRTNYIHTRVIY